MDIDLIPVTITPITKVCMFDCQVTLSIHIQSKKVFMVMQGVIYVAMTEDMDLGHNRPATPILKIVERVLMMMGEVKIRIRPDNLHRLLVLHFASCPVNGSFHGDEKSVISCDFTKEADLCLQRLNIIHFLFADKVLMMLGDVEIGLIPENIPPITKVVLVNH